MAEPTAAAIVIGNEILSGKITDTNSAFLARELRALGVSLQRILVVPDEVETIADAVRAFHPAFDYLFTSGGVGPTHDDVTMAGVAAGLGLEVVRHPVLEEQIRRYVGGELTKAQAKMAEVPAGAELVTGEDHAFPVVRVRNVYILPGIPELFQRKFLSLRSRFAARPFHLRVIYLRGAESMFVPFLDETLAAFPALMVGSYPKWDDPEYHVRITLESKDREYLERAFSYLMAQLPKEQVVRTE